MSHASIREFRKAGTRVRATVLPALVRHWDWLLLAALLWAGFRRLFEFLPGLWFASDTYYAHGAIVPVCAGIVVTERWPRLRTLPLRGSWWPVLALVPVLYLQWLAVRTGLYGLQATLLLLALPLGVLAVGGGRWLRGLAAPLAFLAFGLPLFDGLIDANTVRAQLLSTEFAFRLLQLVGTHPRRLDPTLIALPRFTFDVGIACSGLKVLLAVASSSVFFVLVAGLKPWRNAILIASVLPLALGVNALRIAAIGLIGNAFGPATGMRFHDASGYVSLGVCFGLQYLLTRALGWR